MAGPRSALDGGRGKPADPQVLAQDLEQARFALRNVPVGGGDVAGQRIRCLAQVIGQGGFDEAYQRVDPVLLLQQVRDRA